MKAGLKDTSFVLLQHVCVDWPAPLNFYGGAWYEYQNDCFSVNGNYYYVQRGSAAGFRLVTKVAAKKEK